MNISVRPGKPGHGMSFIFIKATIPAHKRSIHFAFKLRFPRIV